MSGGRAWNSNGWCWEALYIFEMLSFSVGQGTSRRSYYRTGLLDKNGDIGSRNNRSEVAALSHQKQGEHSYHNEYQGQNGTQGTEP